ncbi:MAG: hypothetical protein HUU50_11930 [Candidatus Brocadiae bacterium]|nr:hypothetical protein [Candidatus Brocadiia bacterium]
MEKKISIFILGNSLADNIVAFKLYQSPSIGRLYCLESNTYLKEYCETVPLEMTNYAALGRFIKDNKIDYVFTSSYKAILANVLEYLRSEGIQVVSTKEHKPEFFNNRIDYRKLLSTYLLSVPSSRVFDMYGDAMGYAEESSFPLVAKTQDPGLSATSLCKSVEECKEFLSCTTKAIRYREEEMKVIFEKYIKGQNMLIAGIVKQQEVFLLPNAYSIKTLGEPSFKSLWLDARNAKKHLYKNWESMVLVPTIHAVNRHLEKYHGPLFIDVVFDQKNPYIVDLRAEWDSLYLQAMLHALDSEIISSFMGFYQDIPLDQIELNWHSGGVLGFLLPLTEDTGIYLKAFAKSLQRMPAIEGECSIQVAEGIKEFSGNSYDKTMCITVKAPTCTKAKEFLVSRWNTARLPEDFPWLQNLHSLVMKDW